VSTALALVALDALATVRAVTGLGVAGARLGKCHRTDQPDHGAGDDRSQCRDLHDFHSSCGHGARPPDFARLDARVASSQRPASPFPTDMVRLTPRGGQTKTRR